MGAFQTMRIVLPLIALLVGVVVILLRLEEYLYDRRWTREKILPLIARVEALDEDSREYLDPAILEAYASRKITIDEALELQKQQRT
jgi:hypothetical protein